MSWNSHDTGKNTLTLATAAMNRPEIGSPGSRFFVRCCENGTEFETFGSQVAFVVPQIDLVGTYLRNIDGKGRALMHHYASQLIDLLLMLVTAWTVLAIIFAVYAYFARLKYPVSESVFGPMVVISFFIITASIWLPIVAGALFLSLIGHLWSRCRAKPRK